MIIFVSINQSILETYYPCCIGTKPRHKTLSFHVTERENSITREQPEGRVQGFGELRLELIDQIILLPHRHENHKASLAVEQHPNLGGLGVGQALLHVVVPGRQFGVEPLNAPGAAVPAQAALGALALHAPVADADAAEAALLQLHLPVVDAPLEALEAQHLAVVGEALRVVLVS